MDDSEILDKKKNKIFIEDGYQGNMDGLDGCRTSLDFILESLS